MYTKKLRSEKTMSTDVREIWDNTEKRLSHILSDEYWENEGYELNDDSPMGLFFDDVLEIKREQYLSNGKWITQYYTLVLGTGGPHIEFQTDHHINVYWGGDKAEFTTYDEKAIENINLIEEYLNEIYGSETQ
jgi:hypothetical protein